MSSEKDGELDGWFVFWKGLSKGAFICSPESKALHSGMTGSRYNANDAALGACQHVGGILHPSYIRTFLNASRR